MSIVRLYNCPYFINGECSLRSHYDPLIDFWNNKCIVAPIIPHCPKGREYCHVDVDTDNWSGDALKLIRTLVNGCKRNGNGNTGEIVGIIEQILERMDDMKDYSSLESLCVSRKWSEKKQAEARQEGREEAWDLARRIIDSGSDCYRYEEIHDVFDTISYRPIFRSPVEEALSKDKKFQEEKKALHVGDEVEFTAPGSHKFIEVYKGYVIRFDEESPRWVSILAKDGMYYRSPLMCTKTGKHNPDIEKVMASFEKGENND